MATCILILFYLFRIYYGILIISILLSWLPFLHKYKFVRLLRTIGNWYMKPFTGLIVFAGIDFTPIIGFAVYSFGIEAIFLLL